MSSVKVVISGVRRRDKERLNELVAKMHELNRSRLPIRFDQSVLLRMALDDLLTNYEDAPKRLFARFSGEALGGNNEQ